MRVKRYVVDELSEAVPLIRGELGNDAVILESKEIKIGGFLGMFRKRKLEVLAAVEPHAAKQGNTSTKKLKDDEVDLVIEQIIKASQRSKTIAKERQQSTINNEQLPSEEAGKTAQLMSTNFASRLYGVGKDDGDMASLHAQGRPIQAVVAPATKQTQIQHQELEVPPASKITETEQFIVNELKSLREEMSRLNKNKLHSSDCSEAILALKERLYVQEMDQQWADILIEELIQMEQDANEPFSAEELRQHAKNKLAEWLAPHKQKSLSPESKIIQFVGPTGVGKTTTIAKLAANLSIKEQKKLGLITADTYRIAAVEQLRTYANILNIPLEVVFSPLELERSLNALEHTALILMDTAGRNYQSDLHVSEVNSLLPANAQSEAVLVLSLTSRTGDMKVIAEKFSKYGIRKVVFTKWDETTCYGAIFNMAMLYGLTPLFITSGQNVPDDIETFDLDKYIEILLGETHHV